MVNNLTEGKPLKLLFFFAMPMVVGNLFQQLYNMVDSMVVGRFVGEDALAAVGSSFPWSFCPLPLLRGCPWAVPWLFPSSSGQVRYLR